MKTRSEKIAISIEQDLLRRAEGLRRRTGESRSAVVARALRGLLAVEEHRRRVDEYVGAYRRHPETAESVDQARALARRSLARLPWDAE